MAQAKKVLNVKANRAFERLNDNNPKSLSDNMDIVERDGGVFLRERRMKTRPGPNGPIEYEATHERRVDSPSDDDARREGLDLWYDKLLVEQKARDKKKRPAKKEAE